MKKIVLVAALFSVSGTFAQTFSDNFDSYTAGMPMAQQSGGAWTTWSNAPGGTEDVLVSNANSVSGNNSVYFSTSAQGGGPTDLVKNFGVMNTGQFSIEWNMLVESGKAGYFNFQKTATIGQTWAMDCFFTDNGDLMITNQDGLNFTANYTQGSWFNFRMDINFNSNVWEVFIDDVSVGSFANPVNQIASIDIYPTDQNAPYSCGYFIDDFEYTVTPYSLPSLNGAATFVTFDQGAIAGANVTPKVTIRNLGSTTITSATVGVTYNGNNLTLPLSSLNLASLAQTTVTMPGTVALIAGSNNMVATISNVNGAGADGDPSDDATTNAIDPIVPATGKMVVSEEGTGTWCGWCPRGAVFMDLMNTKYSQYWAGIAVHNGDPMTVTDYDAGMGALISGYPSALVDRGAAIDPSQMESYILDRIVVAPTAFIQNGANWDAASRTLEVSVSADFQSAANNNYKIAIVLTEDGVTGTGSTYNQTNYYAGGANGVMGGYESLPGSVPAAQMVYDHVARVIEPSFGGFANSFPATVTAGSVHTVNATFTLPATWDENQIHIVGMLIAPNGTIDNAGSATIAEAVSNGFVDGTDMNVSITEENQLDAILKLYPNPSTTYTTVSLNLKGESNVVLSLKDMSGATLSTRNYGAMSGAATVDISTVGLAKGAYIVELNVDGVLARRTLIVQ